MTELGCMQARRLGAYIQYLNYTGAIYTDASKAAMQTAEIIANLSGATIAPLEPDMDILRLREDSVIVANSARVDEMVRLLRMPKYNPTTPDCSLTVFDTLDASQARCKDTAHLPSAMISIGSQMKIEEKRRRVSEAMKQGVSVPKEITESKACKLLHIGDTHSEAYPFYEELIQKVRPDIIIHTGDFVDEVKVGRMINTEEEYSTGLRKIAEILRNSGAAAIYAVPGNNDIPELIKEYLPFAQYVEPNSQITICDITCTLGHECYNTTKESQWSFYGHGLSGETWKPEMNTDLNRICRFNVTWGPKVFLLPEKRMFSFREP